MAHMKTSKLGGFRVSGQGDDNEPFRICQDEGQQRGDHRGFPLACKEQQWLQQQLKN